jgi:hypothetical protein
VNASPRVWVAGGRRVLSTPKSAAMSMVFDKYKADTTDPLDHEEPL